MLNYQQTLELKMQEYRDRIETLEELLAAYREDYSASFKEVTRLRKIIQDNA